MIWLIGNKGMLGTQLALTLGENNLQFVGTDRDVDITDIGALRGFANNLARAGTPVTCIINCAAYTNVNKAESDGALCRALNVTGPENIAKVAAETGAVLIHISTDYVFDGKAQSPYTEDMTINPTGVYGTTKAEGEARILAETASAYIIRTAWLYGAYGNNFVFTMMRLMNENGTVKVVSDQFGTPTFANDLADAITEFATNVESAAKTKRENVTAAATESTNAKSAAYTTENKVACCACVEHAKKALPPFGVYHFTNLGKTNWFDFAREIYRIGRESGKITREAEVLPCTTDEYPTPAPRPAYSVLSKDKIAAVLTRPIPQWEESLERFITSIPKNAPLTQSGASSQNGATANAASTQNKVSSPNAADSE